MELADDSPTLNSNKEFLKEKFSFPVSDSPHFASTLPNYRKPIEVGHFCVDRDMLYRGDAYPLRRYKPPDTTEIRFDLKFHGIADTGNVGLNMDIKYQLDPILTWINSHHGVLNAINADEETDDEEEGLQIYCEENKQFDLIEEDTDENEK